LQEEIESYVAGMAEEPSGMGVCGRGRGWVRGKRKNKILIAWASKETPVSYSRNVLIK
jgi:hypothetical protein